MVRLCCVCGFQPRITIRFVYESAPVHKITLGAAVPWVASLIHAIWNIKFPPIFRGIIAVQRIILLIFPYVYFRVKTKAPLAHPPQWPKTLNAFSLFPISLRLVETPIHAQPLVLQLMPPVYLRNCRSCQRIHKFHLRILRRIAWLRGTDKFKASESIVWFDCYLINSVS